MRNPPKNVEPLNCRRLTANAFRVLGVPAGASQADVEAAARKMRVFSETGDVPPTPWDMPWLGKLPRDKNRIEQALASLTEPQSRIDHRLFWFADARAAQGAATTDAAGHDPALAAVAGLMIGDEKFQKLDKWGKALSGLRDATAGATYRDWFLNVERDGDFEKRAADAEVSAALDGMQVALAESVAARIRQFIDAGDLPACLRLLKLLCAAGVDNATAQRITADVCNRVEDLLFARCTRLYEQMNRGLNKPVKGPLRKRWASRRLCSEVDAEVRQSVDPLVDALQAIEGPQSERLRRVGVPAARMMRSLWIGWARAARPQASKAAMRRAQKFARSTPLEMQLLAEARPSARARRQLWWRLAVPIFTVSIYGLSNFFSNSAPPARPPYQMPQFSPRLPTNYPPSPELRIPGLERPGFDVQPPTFTPLALPNSTFPQTPLNFDPSTDRHDPPPAEQPR